MQTAASRVLNNALIAVIQLDIAMMDLDMMGLELKIQRLIDANGATYDARERDDNFVQALCREFGLPESIAFMSDEELVYFVEPTRID